jgi:hypothetical protein
MLAYDLPFHRIVPSAGPRSFHTLSASALGIGSLVHFQASFYLGRRAKAILSCIIDYFLPPCPWVTLLFDLLDLECMASMPGSGCYAYIVFSTSVSGLGPF